MSAVGGCESLFGRAVVAILARPLAAGWAIGVALIAGPLRRGIDTEVDLARANSEWTIFSGEPA